MSKINPSGPFGHLVLFYVIPNHFILGGVQGWDVIHGGMKLASWIFSGVRNSVSKLGSNKNTQQPIFHVLRELFTWLAPVPYAGVSPGAYKELRILSSSLLDYGWSATFKGNSRVIGWISFWPLILTCTTRTCPSWCGKTTTDRLEHFDRQRTRHPQLLGCPSPPSISFGY